MNLIWEHFRHLKAALRDENDFMGSSRYWSYEFDFPVLPLLSSFALPRARSTGTLMERTGT